MIVPELSTTAITTPTPRAFASASAAATIFRAAASDSNFLLENEVLGGVRRCQRTDNRERQHNASEYLHLFLRTSDAVVE